MNAVFHSPWICDELFRNVPPRPVRHKELDPVKIPPSPKERQNHHVLFRKSLTYAGGKVEILWTADDYAKLYVNGVYASQGPTPAYYEKTNFLRTDLTPFLKKGENKIVLHAYYQGLVNRVWESADDRFGVIADFYRDGVYLEDSPEGWEYFLPQEYREAEVFGIHGVQFAENTDLRLARPETLAGHGEGWKKACFKENDDHGFASSPLPALVTERIRPQKVVKKAGGGYFIDFGREILGHFCAEMQGEPGQVTVIYHGEETRLYDKESVKWRMRCECDYREERVLSGGVDKIEFFDYRGFRYVELENAPDGCEESFAAELQHRAWKKAIGLKKDVPDDLRAIWDLCEHTIHVATRETLADCPTREKGQYLGDLGISGIARMVLCDDADFLRNALSAFADSSSICPGLMAVAPCSLMQEIADYSLQYGGIVWKLYAYTRDLSVLREFYPVCKGVIDYFSRFAREDGLLCAVREKWNLVDWPSLNRDGYDFDLKRPLKPTEPHNVLNAWWIGAVMQLEQIENELGIPSQNRSRDLIAAFDRAFLDENGLYRDAEASSHHAFHSNVLPVYFGFAPESSKQAIRDLIAKKGLCCGVYFSYFALRACAKLGDKRLELAFLTNQSERGWMNMLREGATTTFEAWGKSGKRNISLCHPWACAPIPVLYEDFPELLEKA